MPILFSKVTNTWIGYSPPLQPFIAPTVAPKNVQTTRLNDTHMNISWELSTLEEARGFIDTITITFTPTSVRLQCKKRQVVTVEVPGNSTPKVIVGLDPELPYSVTVSTSTSEGGGPETTAVVPSKNLIQGAVIKLLPNGQKLTQVLKQSSQMEAIHVYIHMLHFAFIPILVSQLCK